MGIRVQQKVFRKTSAIRAERYVKSMKSREFLKKLIAGEYSLSEFDD